MPIDVHPGKQKCLIMNRIQMFDDQDETWDNLREQSCPIPVIPRPAVEERVLNTRTESVVKEGILSDIRQSGHLKVHADNAFLKIIPCDDTPRATEKDDAHTTGINAIRGNLCFRRTNLKSTIVDLGESIVLHPIAATFVNPNTPFTA